MPGNEFDSLKIDTASGSSRKPPRRKRFPPWLAVVLTLAVLGVLLLAYVEMVYVPEQRQQRTRLHFLRLALLYHEYNDAKRHAPPNLDALLEYAASGQTFNAPESYEAPLAIEMIKRGEFIVLWNAEFSQDGEENNKYVLGYETDAAENGGLVLMAGGSAHTVSASEFQRLPKIPTRDPQENE